MLYENGTQQIPHKNKLIKSNLTPSSVSCWYLPVAAELNADAAAVLSNKNMKY